MVLALGMLTDVRPYWAVTLLGLPMGEHYDEPALPSEGLMLGEAKCLPRGQGAETWEGWDLNSGNTNA